MAAEKKAKKPADKRGYIVRAELNDFKLTKAKSAERGQRGARDYLTEYRPAPGTLYI